MIYRRVCACCGKGAREGAQLPARKAGGLWLLCDSCAQLPREESLRLIQRRLTAPTRKAA